MSRRAIRRTLAIARTSPNVVGADRGVLPGGVPQPPLAVLELPKMRRAETVGEVHEILPVHDRLLEAAARFWELLLRQAQVGEDFLGEALGELAVETPDQRYALFPRDVLRADLLRRVIG